MVVFYGICRQIYQSHGSYGYCFIFLFDCCGVAAAALKDVPLEAFSGSQPVFLNCSETRKEPFFYGKESVIKIFQIKCVCYVFFWPNSDG